MADFSSAAEGRSASDVDIDNVDWFACPFFGAIVSRKEQLMIFITSYFPESTAPMKTRVNWKNRRFIIAAWLAFFPVAWLGTSTAYAVNVILLNSGPSSFQTVNPNTGEILNTFPTPVDLVGPVAGLSMAEGGDSLIFTDAGSPSPGSATPLYRLNPFTGAVLSTHPLPLTARGGLSYHTNAGTDFIFSINDGPPIQRQLGFDGPLMPVGPAGQSFPGALGGDDNGRQFIFRGSAIHEIDLDGISLNSFNNPVPGLSGLAFDGESLYGVGTATRNLFTLDPDTGAVLNSVPVDGPGVFAGAAAFAIPEPSTLLLAALGLLGLLGFARRRK